MVLQILKLKPKNIAVDGLGGQGTTVHSAEYTEFPNTFSASLHYSHILNFFLSNKNLLRNEDVQTNKQM
jgi:hypothetical protein